MISLSIKKATIDALMNWLQHLPWVYLVIAVAITLALSSTLFALFHGLIISYGDSESHLNISKRVVDSITPGMAQLGGIWLPIPHLLMVPLVKIEFLYRSGLAGSLVSGTGYIITCIYIYKLVYFLTKNYLAALFGFFIFATNPNILYLQSTPLTEIVLITFFVLSSYYFVRFVHIALHNKDQEILEEKQRDKEYLFLIIAAFFGFCASLSRYDGWFLVAVEAMVIVMVYLPIRRYWNIIKEDRLKSISKIISETIRFRKTKSFYKLQGMVVLFISLAFLGIGLWLLWDYLILDDPFYFTNSQFSARTQQEEWRLKGQLPAYHNLPLSLAYFFFAAMTNVGVITYAVTIIAVVDYIFKKRGLFNFFLMLILLVPFIFNVITLYMGQSIIFIPHITPANFEWKIFNVRYGALMVPAAAIFCALLFYFVRLKGKLLLIFLLILQFGLFAIGYSKVISASDGTEGLSSAKKPDAEFWMAKEYDQGLVLIDDYARSLSIIRSGIPMQKIIYIGNKPYWQESLKTPEKHATWIIMQKNDAVYKGLYADKKMQKRLYKYFKKVYTSVDILIFKRNS